MSLDRHAMLKIKANMFARQPYARVNNADYIYFSRTTMGRNGRTVKISKSLIIKFFTYLDPKSHDGRQAIRQIENLTAKAGGLESLKNSLNAIEYMLHVGEIRIFYKIIQGGYGAPVEVLITDIKPGNKSHVKEGMYRLLGGGESGLRPYPDGSIKIVDTDAYINGFVGDDASLIEACQRSADGVKASTIYYNPHDVTNEMGTFKSSKTTYAAQGRSEDLAEVLEKNKGAAINWRVEGEGVGLMLSALDKVKSKLPNFTVRLINPIGESPKLLSSLKQKGASVEERVATYDHSMNKQAMISFKLKSEEMMSHLKGMPEARSERAQANSLTRQLGMQLQNLKSETDTLVDILNR